MRKELRVLNLILLKGFLIHVILLMQVLALCAGEHAAPGPNAMDHGTHDGKFEESAMKDANQLTEDEGKILLSVARKTIEGRLFDQDGHPTETDLSPKFLEKRGTFVTLTTAGSLRGCIGHIIPKESLIEGIRINAINAAFQDPRFPPLSKGEWKRVKIEISILTEPRPLSYADAEDLLSKLRPGVDGVIIRKGYCQAVFLPQVWDQLPKKEDFLTHLCLKAGLGGNEWEKGGLEVSVYQVQSFEEE